MENPRKLLFVCLFSTALVVLLPLHTAEPAALENLPGQKESSYSAKRIVSLVPSATEILDKLGLREQLRGVTINDWAMLTRDKTLVGSVFNPVSPIIIELQPDIVILSSLHDSLGERLALDKSRLIKVDISNVDDLYRSINHLGKVFNREEEAQKLVKEVQEEIALIASKVSHIEPRKRVMRFMGRKDSSTVMAPGDDSFQNEIVRLAGGTPPLFGRSGEMVEVSLEEWKRFNPEVLYGCGEDREIAEKFFDLEGWKDVKAVKDNKIFYFPCGLTCRISINTGKFISWLASLTYEKEFADPSSLVKQEKIEGSKVLDLKLSYVRSARITKSTIMDFSHKTLLVEFKNPIKVLSTLEGPRDGIKMVGNHYTPPPAWSISHKLGLKEWRNRISKVLAVTPTKTSLLFTGANMDNLSVIFEQEGDLTVYALVTAGASSNALRTSKDPGAFMEPGTINIILLTNRSLTPQAMARAIITATEAKTAALQDLDIRSSFNPTKWQATGTGTDEIIVVGGPGKTAQLTGGHTKLGELIAKSVYKGVKEALYLQNGFFEKRHIFKRLEERHLELYSILPKEIRGWALPALEEMLLKPSYGLLMEVALSLSDSREQERISEIGDFRKLACLVGSNFATSYCPKVFISDMSVPEPIRIALDGLLNGLHDQPNTSPWKSISQEPERKCKAQ